MPIVSICMGETLHNCEYLLYIPPRPMFSDVMAETTSQDFTFPTEPVVYIATTPLL